MGVTHCMKLISVHYFIFLQLIIFLPLVLIRDLAKLSTTALVADGFILAGLLYIFGSEFAIIGREGLAKVELFNPKDFPLFIGCVMLSFQSNDGVIIIFIVCFQNSGVLFRGNWFGTSTCWLRFTNLC